jgi:hypothetical protein
MEGLSICKRGHCVWNSISYAKDVEGPAHARIEEGISTFVKTTPPNFIFFYNMAKPPPHLALLWVLQNIQGSSKTIPHIVAYVGHVENRKLGKIKSG